jgi:hypothetical protein
MFFKPLKIMKQKMMMILIVLGFLVPDNIRAQTATNDGNFVSLFNGKDLTGWHAVGTPSFTVKEHAIYTTGAKPYPSWLRTEKEYENFVLRFAYKTTGWYEGGILFHAPQEGPAEKIGFKLLLRHDQHALGTHSPGAIYNVVAPDTLVNFPSKEWNHCEVLCDWPVLRVKMNGIVIQNIDMSKNEMLKHRMRRGYIGIQNIGGRGTYFEDIEIRTLPDKESPWTYLFRSGMDELTLEGNSDWAVLKDILTARGNNAMAYTKKAFSGPFEMQVWVKNMVDGNGGIVFTGKDKNERAEIQCFNVEGSTNPTGSIYGIAAATRVVSRDLEWYLIQIFSEGKNVKVFVNGEMVAETDALNTPLSGIIGFQQHTPNGFIQYRGARIKMP